MKNLFFCVCLFITYGSTVPALDGNYHLKSVAVLFRHGDRTPRAYPTEFYKNDPYRAMNFEPLGYGSLTNVGKRREYQIGTSLRKRYNEFLGDNYKSSEVSVISTGSERTEMSLLLVLAGLYPPKNKQIWKDGLDWQPVPIHSVLSGIESFTKPSECPTFIQERERVLNSKEYKADISRLKDVMNRLSVYTGNKIDSIKKIYNLFHTLTAEQAMNLTLPAWTKHFFPNGAIINATLLQYKYDSFNTEMKKLNGGLFVRKILNDLIFKRNAQSEKNPKINLYSAHENHVGAVLQTLNLWKNEIPKYSSGIIFELHEKESKYFIKMLYYKGIPSEYEDRIIPGCSEYCPIEDFVELNKDVLPEDILEACYGPPSNSMLIPKNINPIIWIYNKIREWFSI